MRLLSALVLVLGLAAGGLACSKTDPAPAATPAAAAPVAAKPGAKAPAAQQWTCPMDKDVIASKPGNCPKCGMALVLKK